MAHLHGLAVVIPVLHIVVDQQVVCEVGVDEILQQLAVGVVRDKRFLLVKLKLLMMLMFLLTVTGCL